ncbi:hypothetical protein [Bradyrhizobium cenepequi]|uniref:hypothetical protein n=1 Tax=Bradyrhizobium cenepequi TaxID=2821403 RepID=UPI001CE2D0BE|nr:hypothetical protein [Bradyrhizobium cenepequi]MCA6113055.1 hypothetical protein [Bradyrhizobium cenepequi]
MLPGWPNAPCLSVGAMRICSATPSVPSDFLQLIEESLINSNLVLVFSKLVLASTEAIHPLCNKLINLLDARKLMRATAKLPLLVLLALTGCLFPTFAQDKSLLIASICNGVGRLAPASIPLYVIAFPSGEALGSSIDLHELVLNGPACPYLPREVRDSQRRHQYSDARQLHLGQRPHV